MGCRDGHLTQPCREGFLSGRTGLDRQSGLEVPKQICEQQVSGYLGRAELSGVK